jgi:hypothetical protein
MNKTKKEKIELKPKNINIVKPYMTIEGFNFGSDNEKDIDIEIKLHFLEETTKKFEAYLCLHWNSEDTTNHWQEDSDTEYVTWWACGAGDDTNAKKGEPSSSDDYLEELMGIKQFPDNIKNRIKKHIEELGLSVDNFFYLTINSRKAERCKNE